MRQLLAAIGFLISSLVLARLGSESALFWQGLSVLPRSAWVALAAALEPLNSSDVHAQEELLEFVACWLVAVIALAIVVGILVLARQLADGKRRAVLED